MFLLCACCLPTLLCLAPRAVVHVAEMAEEDYMLAKQVLGDIIPGNSQDHNLPKMPKVVQVRGCVGQHPCIQDSAA